LVLPHPAATAPTAITVSKAAAAARARLCIGAV
jgi:hypothetical protein